MQNIVFANNIATTLAASLTSSQTTATLASSAGLPTLATGQIFPLTLNDAATQTIYEIVYVTAISGATLTIERGKEGTASRAWSVGDFAFSTNTAATTSDPYDVQGATYYTGADIGTANTYAVTLSPVPLALTSGMEVSIQNIVGTNTGASTLNVNATGALPIYYPGNVALGANSLIATYGATFRLNHAGTAWTLLDSTGADVGPTAALNDNSNKRATTAFVQAQIAASTPSSASVSGLIKNFKSAVPGLNSYTTLLTADEAVLQNGSGAFLTQSSISLTVNANGTVGAPLSVTSARAASTWYYRWLWYNATNGLTATLDTSATAPTAPTGYASTDYKCLLPGASRTDSSGSTYLLNLETVERESRYVVLTSSNVPNLPTMVTGAQSAWTAVATGAYIPTGIAKAIVVTSSSFGSTGQIVGIAPNASYGAYNSATNPPPFVSAAGAGVVNNSQPYEMQLESTNIYVAITGGGAGVSCIGWRD